MKETRTAEKNKQYNDKYKTIRVSVDDYNELLRVSAKSRVPLVGLISLSVPMLKRKYRIKDVSDGDKL